MERVHRHFEEERAESASVYRRKPHRTRAASIVPRGNCRRR